MKKCTCTNNKKGDLVITVERCPIKHASSSDEIKVKEHAKKRVKKRRERRTKVPRKKSSELTHLLSTLPRIEKKGSRDLLDIFLKNCTDERPVQVDHDCQCELPPATLCPQVIPCPQVVPCPQVPPCQQEPPLPETLVPPCTCPTENLHYDITSRIEPEPFPPSCPCPTENISYDIPSRIEPESISVCTAPYPEELVPTLQKNASNSPKTASRGIDDCNCLKPNDNPVVKGDPLFYNRDRLCDIPIGPSKSPRIFEHVRRKELRCRARRYSVHKKDHGKDRLPSSQWQQDKRDLYDIYTNLIVGQAGYVSPPSGLKSSLKTCPVKKRCVRLREEKSAQTIPLTSDSSLYQSAGTPSSHNEDNVISEASTSEKGYKNLRQEKQLLNTATNVNNLYKDKSADTIAGNRKECPVQASCQLLARELAVETSLQNIRENANLNNRRNGGTSCTQFKTASTYTSNDDNLCSAAEECLAREINTEHGSTTSSKNVSSSSLHVKENKCPHADNCMKIWMKTFIDVISRSSNIALVNIKDFVPNEPGECPKNCKKMLESNDSSHKSSSEEIGPCPKDCLEYFKQEFSKQSREHGKCPNIEKCLQIYKKLTASAEDQNEDDSSSKEHAISYKKMKTKKKACSEDCSKYFERLISKQSRVQNNCPNKKKCMKSYKNFRSHFSIDLQDEDDWSEEQQRKSTYPEHMQHFNRSTFKQSKAQQKCPVIEKCIQAYKISQTAVNGQNKDYNSSVYSDKLNIGEEPCSSRCLKYFKEFTSKQSGCPDKDECPAYQDLRWQFPKDAQNKDNDFSDERVVTCSKTKTFLKCPVKEECLKKFKQQRPSNISIDKDKFTEVHTQLPAVFKQPRVPRICPNKNKSIELHEEQPVEFSISKLSAPDANTRRKQCPERCLQYYEEYTSEQSRCPIKDECIQNYKDLMSQFPVDQKDRKGNFSEMVEECPNREECLKIFKQSKEAKMYTDKNKSLESKQQPVRRYDELLEEEQKSSSSPEMESNDECPVRSQCLSLKKLVDSQASPIRSVYPSSFATSIGVSSRRGSGVSQVSFSTRWGEKCLPVNNVETAKLSSPSSIEPNNIINRDTFIGSFASSRKKTLRGSISSTKKESALSIAKRGIPQSPNNTESSFQQSTNTLAYASSRKTHFNKRCSQISNGHSYKCPAIENCIAQGQVQADFQEQAYSPSTISTSSTVECPADKSRKSKQSNLQKKHSASVQSKIGQVYSNFKKKACNFCSFSKTKRPSKTCTTKDCSCQTSSFDKSHKISKNKKGIISRIISSISTYAKEFEESISRYFSDIEDTKGKSITPDCSCDSTSVSRERQRNDIPSRWDIARSLEENYDVIDKLLPLWKSANHMFKKVVTGESSSDDDVSVVSRESTCVPDIDVLFVDMKRADTSETTNIDLPILAEKAPSYTLSKEEHRRQSGDERTAGHTAKNNLQKSSHLQYSELSHVSMQTLPKYVNQSTGADQETILKSSEPTTSQSNVSISANISEDNSSRKPKKKTKKKSSSKIVAISKPSTVAIQTSQLVNPDISGTDQTPIQLKAVGTSLSKSGKDAKEKPSSKVVSVNNPSATSIQTNKFLHSDINEKDQSQEQVKPAATSSSKSNHEAKEQSSSKVVSVNNSGTTSIQTEKFVNSDIDQAQVQVKSMNEAIIPSTIVNKSKEEMVIRIVLDINPQKTCEEIRSQRSLDHQAQITKSIVPIEEQPPYNREISIQSQMPTCKICYERREEKGLEAPRPDELPSTVTVLSILPRENTALRYELNIDELFRNTGESLKGYKGDRPFLKEPEAVGHLVLELYKRGILKNMPHRQINIPMELEEAIEASIVDRRRLVTKKLHRESKIRRLFSKMTRKG